jgi:Zn-dependent protease with chaperone function
MGLACPEVIYSSRESFVALTAGVRRPVLFLSAPLLAEFTSLELEHILLHELAHIRRGDGVYLLTLRP